MVYDGLLFGGQDTGTFGLIFQTAQYFGDTWQWDGKHWTRSGGALAGRNDL
jgi:hypothetical protein